MGSNDTVRNNGVEEILAAARRALEERGTFEYGNTKLEKEFYELGLLTPSERFAAADIALSQIRPEHWCGPDRPGNISFPPYGGRTLYAFKWYSPEHQAMMYLKLCITGTPGMEILVLYSFHKDRP